VDKKLKETMKNEMIAAFAKDMKNFRTGDPEKFYSAMLADTLATLKMFDKLDKNEIPVAENIRIIAGFFLLTAYLETRIRQPNMEDSEFLIQIVTEMTFGRMKEFLTSTLD